MLWSYRTQEIANNWLSIKVDNFNTAAHLPLSPFFPLQIRPNQIKQSTISDIFLLFSWWLFWFIYYSRKVNVKRKLRTEKIFTFKNWSNCKFIRITWIFYDYSTMIILTPTYSLFKLWEKQFLVMILSTFIHNNIWPFFWVCVNLFITSNVSDRIINNIDLFYEWILSYQILLEHCKFCIRRKCQE